VFRCSYVKNNVERNVNVNFKLIEVDDGEAAVIRDHYLDEHCSDDTYLAADGVKSVSKEDLKGEKMELKKGTRAIL